MRDAAFTPPSSPPSSPGSKVASSPLHPPFIPLAKHSPHTPRGDEPPVEAGGIPLPILLHVRRPSALRGHVHLADLDDVLLAQADAATNYAPGDDPAAETSR